MSSLQSKGESQAYNNRRVEKNLLQASLSDQTVNNTTARANSRIMNEEAATHGDTVTKKRGPFVRAPWSVSAADRVHEGRLAASAVGYRTEAKRNTPPIARYGFAQVPPRPQQSHSLPKQLPRFHKSLLLYRREELYLTISIGSYVEHGTGRREGALMALDCAFQAWSTWRKCGSNIYLPLYRSALPARTRPRILDEPLNILTQRGEHPQRLSVPFCQHLFRSSLPITKSLNLRPLSPLPSVH